jgi:hypothetical protein
MAGSWEVIAFLPRLRGRWITREARETEGAPIDARSARHFPRKRGKKDAEWGAQLPRTCGVR